MNIKLSNSEKTDLIYELLNLLLLDFNENIDDILSDQVLTREGIRLLSKSEKIDVIYGLSNLLPKDVLISILLDFNESIDDLINILSDQVLFQKWFANLSPKMDKVSPTPVVIITLQSGREINVFDLLS